MRWCTPSGCLYRLVYLLNNSKRDLHDARNAICITLATFMMFQNVPKDSKSAQMTPTSPSDKWRAYGTLRSRLCADLRTPPLPPWGGERIIGGAWGSPEAGTPHGIRGWGSKRQSPAAMLHCFCRTRNLHKSGRTPCLLPVVVPPFVGARHV